MLKKLTASYALALFSFIVLLGSCTKDYEPIEASDETKLQQYIQSNKLTVEKDSTGFYYQVLKTGTGNNFTNKDSVLYHATIKSLLNGTTYYTDPANGNFGTYVGYANDFNGYNIPAIRTAMLALKPGGSVRILLPSYLAFGRNGFATINVPSNELIDLVITTMPEQKQSDLDDRLIREFITAKGITNAVKGPGGIYYVIIAPGDAASPINGGSTVTAKYTGRLLDGTVFDSSADGLSFSLTGVIKGWTKTIPLINKGGKIRILVPSLEGYGTAGSSPIPGNAVLDFDIEVTAVSN
ncbi:FKBP-type peptidyl-prolyl cis-trans isomerase [Pedobacter sp.]|uniref:FKBP-type peptidyl-prolyl cis-trans isomerase n=1 Tax=Pedobacter sp. TaxID=1411316 RepID=UPI003D7F6C4C